tara:strand:+ start:1316 stop:1885 length:570 start_codon:yes stop_codon:yes gene_type:complete
MDIEKYINIYDNKLSLEVISSIIKWCNKSSFQPGTVGKGDLIKDIRDTQILHLLNWEDNSKTKIHWCNFLYRFFIEHFLIYCKNNYTLNNDDIINGIEDISILKYQEGGKYRPHIDSFKTIPRTLSAILLLNNEYEGGKLKFFYPSGELMKEIKPTPGRLIIWPSNFMYPHAVEPVKKGIRYSVVSWAL